MVVDVNLRVHVHPPAKIGASGNKRRPAWLSRACHEKGNTAKLANPIWAPGKG